MWNLTSLLTYYVAMLLGACTLAIAVQNPIHSIIMLIAAFIMGSLVLTNFTLDYFALLFLIVYVGAIVVLFLFIVMMLELKMVNISERYYDLFNYKNLLLACLLVELLFLEQADAPSSLGGFYAAYITNNVTEASAFIESNLYIDYSRIVNAGDLLTALGLSLFRYEKVGILLAALLLFVSMVGSIVLTMDSKEILTIKGQNANAQALRSPVPASKSVRSSLMLLLEKPRSWGDRAERETVRWGERRPSGWGEQVAELPQDVDPGGPGGPWGYILLALCGVILAGALGYLYKSISEHKVDNVGTQKESSITKDQVQQPDSSNLREPTHNDSGSGGSE